MELSITIVSLIRCLLKNYINIDLSTNILLELIWIFSSCFQLVGDRGLDLKEMESLLQPGRNPDIDKIYNNFNVQDVQVNVISKY